MEVDERMSVEEGNLARVRTHGLGFGRAARARVRERRGDPRDPALPAPVGEPLGHQVVDAAVQRVLVEQPATRAGAAREDRERRAIRCEMIAMKQPGGRGDVEAGMRVSYNFV